MNGFFTPKKGGQIVVRMNFSPMKLPREIENHSTTLKKTFGSSWRVFFPILNDLNCPFFLQYNKARGVRVGGKLSHHSMNQHVKVTVDG